ncbi:MAG: FecR domain-containing protein [Myxococcales bacterium]
MNTRRIAIAVTLTALLTILFIWLSGESPLAQISKLEGGVDRDRKGSEEQWFTANLGDELSLGDAVRTAKQSRAKLVMSEGTVLDVAPSTIVRLLSDAPKRERFRVESGSAEVQAGENAVIFETARGTVQVERGAKVTVREEEDGSTWVRVDMGRAQIGWEESQKVLMAGQELRSSKPKLKTPATSTSSTAPALDKARAAEQVPTREPKPASDPSAASEPNSTRELGANPTPRKPDAPSPASQGMAARVRGNQVKVQAKGDKTARGIAEGDHVLAVGTLVTVDGTSSLELTQAEGGSLVTQGKTSLVVGDGSKVATRVLNGKLRAEAGRVPLEVEVPGGRILLMVDDKGGAAGSIQTAKTGTQVSAERGNLMLRGKDKEERLSKGSQGSLSTRGLAAVDYHPPSMRDMMLTAGVSTTVHDPQPPTAVALQVGTACGGDATLVEQQTARGFQVRGETRDQLLLWFGQGTTAYRLRCQSEGGAPGKIVANGRVQVQHDGAARRVTKRAPELELDLDGRKYTAVYQTLLPKVRVRAPAGLAGEASLRVEGSGPTKTFKLLASGLTLESGQLGEGTHSLSFVGKSAAPAKKPTTLVIRFDNSAPAAYLEGEGALKPAGDGSVEISGAALDDSQITVDGKPVSLDRAARFDARVVPDPKARGVGLWIRHPRLGSHHYVRRIQGRDQTP